MFQRLHLSNEKGTLVVLGYVEDLMILPKYIGIIIDHYKDPDETTSISWKVRDPGFFSWLHFLGFRDQPKTSFEGVNPSEFYPPDDVGVVFSKVFFLRNHNLVGESIKDSQSWKNIYIYTYKYIYIHTYDLCFFY